MSEKIKVPMFPFTYLKQDLSMKGVVPSFSPGINKQQFFYVMYFILVNNATIQKTIDDIDLFLQKNKDIDYLAPAFPFTTFIDDKQVIIPGITIYELFCFLEYLKVTTVTIDDIAKLFFPDREQNTIVLP